MSSIVQEIDESSAAMLDNPPEDIRRMRQRMGARGQNASICFYAYADIGAASGRLYSLEVNILREDYDLHTLLDSANSWLDALADRIPRYYRYNDTSALLYRVTGELRSCKDRRQARQIVQALQHYMSALRFWIDLEIPWPEVGVAFAEAKGDSAPVAP
jgi:hypothetical protein